MAKAVKDKSVSLKLGAITETIQLRTTICDEAVATYGELLRNKRTGGMDPVRAVRDDDGNIYVWEGDHRCRGADAHDQKTIKAIVTPGTRDEALLLAARANQNHGVRRTGADKRKAVTTLLKHPVHSQLKDRALAAAIGVSHTLVKEIRNDLSNGHDGSKSTKHKVNGKAAKKAKLSTADKTPPNEVDELVESDGVFSRGEESMKARKARPKNREDVDATASALATANDVKQATEGLYTLFSSEAALMRDADVERFTQCADVLLRTAAKKVGLTPQRVSRVAKKHGIAVDGRQTHRPKFGAAALHKMATLQRRYDVDLQAGNGD